MKKISNSELKSKIMRWDTERWRSDKESKTTLAVYRLQAYSRFKKEISEEEIYVNDYNSVQMQEQHIEVGMEKQICEWTIMENWNQDHPERYSNFHGKFVKFQGCGKWPWSW